MTYACAKTEARRLSAAEARRVRADHEARANAKAQRRAALEVLRTVPALPDHARRLGLNVSSLKQIVRGETYKDVGCG